MIITTSIFESVRVVVNVQLFFTGAAHSMLSTPDNVRLQNRETVPFDTRAACMT